MKLIFRGGTLLAFFGSLLLYWCCVEPGASFWDCPEYILVAYRLEVGHPPGNPAWQLMANVASHLAPSVSKVALAINLTSGLATALAAALLFQVIFFFVRYMLPRGSMKSAGVAALTGALAFAWADSTIFSAVEAEVYALSIFFTVLMIWLMLKWAMVSGEDTAARNKAAKLLICAAYVTGLSLGVHELNLLAIPAMALIWLFRRYPGATGRRLWATIAGSFALVGFILLMWFPGLVYLAGKSDVWTANILGWPYYAGAISFLVVLFIGLFSLPFLAAALRASYGMVTACWSLFFLTLGMGVYVLLPIRAAANPPINEGDPATPQALYAYFKRDQYGGAPLFYGHTPYSEPLRIEDTDSAGTHKYTRLYRERKRPLTAPWRKGAVWSNRKGMLTAADSFSNKEVEEMQHGYITYDYVAKLKYAPELDMWFPRLTSTDPSDISAYADWAGMTEKNMVEVTAANAVDSTGKPLMRVNAAGEREGKKTKRPTYLQQLQYMTVYQFGYMYFRYLLWNFSGRQNNYPATGEIEHGNFITGFSLIDDAMLGPQSKLPSELRENNRGYNRYFLIPLAMGLLGAFGVRKFGRRGRRSTTVVLLLFLMTGVAIVFYLNQNPGEARERDYSFLGSFMAFAIWIGFGAAIIMHWAGSVRKLCKVAIVAGAIVSLGVPVLMLSQTYDDHDRRGRDSAGALGRNVLESVEEDAILIVDGDNLTFPLWYAQEVLGVRRDVTIINLTYLSTPWYAPQFQVPGEGRLPLKMSGTPERTLYDAFSLVEWNPAGGVKDAVAALEEMYSRKLGSGVPMLDASTVRIKVPGRDSLRLNLRDVASGGRYLQRYHLSILDILAHNGEAKRPRPVYWQRNIPARGLIGLKDSTMLLGGVRRLSPGYTKEDRDRELLRSYERFKDWYSAGTPSAVQEPYSASMISWQRISGLLLARALADAGMHRETLSVVKIITEKWPFSAAPSRTLGIDGESLSEDKTAIQLLRVSGRELDDAKALQLADSLEVDAKERLRAFEAYKRALTPAQRYVLSPATRSLR